MRILLVQPPIRDFYRTRFREYPLGLLYLGAALRANGHEVSLLDARYSRRPKRLPLPEKMVYLSEIYRKENNLFLYYQHFGLSFDEISRRVSETAPDAVVINAMFTPYLDEVQETAHAVRAAAPNCRIIVGGHHATVDPHSLLKSGDVDQIVLGEGEVILPRISSEKITDTIVSDNGNPFCVEDLDALLHPARDLIDASRYRFGKRNYAMIMTSRGCPHRCRFCSVHSMVGHHHRTRNIEDVMQEMRDCYERYGIRAFDLQDDNLLFDQDRVKELFERMIKDVPINDIEVMATNGLNVAHLNSELLSLMKQVSFRKLDLAIVTGDVSGRDSLERPEAIKKYEEVLEISRYLDLPVTTYIILGVPTQPIQEMNETVDYLMSKETLIAPSIFYNVPGMPIFDKMKQYEYCDDHQMRRSSTFNNFGIDFTRDDIVSLFKKIRTYNLSLTRDVE